MFSKSLLAAASVAALAVDTVKAIPTISAVGSKFFTSNGNQFYIKGNRTYSKQTSDTLANQVLLGVAYQPGPDDPLINTNQCQLDASQMKDLGANTIRVYHVDPAGDHKGCMSAFADAGIYLFVDLDTFTTQITQVGYTGVIASGAC